MAYKTFPGKNLTLFTQVPQFSSEQKHNLLDTWAREIRSMTGTRNEAGCFIGILLCAIYVICTIASTDRSTILGRYFSESWFHQSWLFQESR